MNQQADSDLPVVVLVRDLVFASRIRAAAEDAGVSVAMVRDPARLGPQPGRKLIVDLNLEGAIAAVAQWRDSRPGAQVVGFVSHTDTPTIEAARAAGVDRIMARSAFVQSIHDILR